MDFNHFCYSQFERDQRSQLNNETFSKISFATEVLGICIPEVKKEREREEREEGSGCQRVRAKHFQKFFGSIHWKF